MEENLIDLRTNKLLDKFGAGNHKPGSGSAAALQGMLSAQLMKTVINLTINKRKFKPFVSKLKEINEAVENRIYPALEKCFQEDSELFDLAIETRRKRDQELNRRKKIDLTNEALEKLKPSTEMPIEIAKLCVELAEYGFYIFDHGFEAVRGDSGVSINSAHSAIGGCLNIIDLNLTSFPTNEWTDHIKEKTKNFRIKYLQIAEGIKLRLESLQLEADRKNKYLAEFKMLESNRGKKLNNSDIEKIAQDLQNLVWENRDLIWKKDIPADPIQILDSKEILKLINYQLKKVTTLGQYVEEGKSMEIAGIIDQENRIVSISNQFPEETQNFTSAHEIGHALLHEELILHRDRPLNGSNQSNNRDIKETQADKFATFFLMPGKQIMRAFNDLFGMKKFILNNDTLFIMNLKSHSEFRSKFKNQEQLSRFFASTEFFNGRGFESMAKIFNVSIETMAIRLKELNLVLYPKYS